MRYFVAPSTHISNSWWYVRDREFPDQPNMAVWQMWAAIKGSREAANDMCDHLNREAE